MPDCQNGTIFRQRQLADSLDVKETPSFFETLSRRVGATLWFAAVSGMVFAELSGMVLTAGSGRWGVAAKCCRRAAGVDMRMA